MLTCVDRSTRPIHHTRIQRFVLTVEIIRRHCTICQVNSSRSAQYPCQALISIRGISRLSRFVIVFVLRLLLQDEPELQPDEEGLDLFSE